MRGGGGGIHYFTIDDKQSRAEKLSVLQKLDLSTIDFARVTPDSKSNWLNHSDSDFDSLLPLANRQTKLAKSVHADRAVFRLYSMGATTNRDEWVYAFSTDILSEKMRYFIDTYERTRLMYGGSDFDDSILSQNIKWTRDLKKQLRRNIPNYFDRARIREVSFRPFIRKFLYHSQNLNEMLNKMPAIFPSGEVDENKVICFCTNGKDFYVLASNRVFDLHFTGDTQCLPLYRYTQQGNRVSNITEWGLQQFRTHYADASITAEQVFAYVYAALHHPAYRRDYAIDLLREFPRVPFYDDFYDTMHKGQALLALHLDFESTTPYRLIREESNAAPGKPRLRTDHDAGVIVIDNATRLRGVPEDVWRYRLGNRSAIEWVLDQYKERKPKTLPSQYVSADATFAHHKEQVIDLLRRICAVSVKTMAIVDELSD